VKLRSAPLDDIFQELQFTLNRDGGRLARFTGWLFLCAYRALKTAMLLVLTWKWRTKQPPYPEPGHELFNLTPEEMAGEWRQR
jgi:hypothetical protein